MEKGRRSGPEGLDWTKYGYVGLGETLDGLLAAAGLDWAVTKCVTCHGTMHKSEKTCFMCGSDVPPDPDKVTLQQRFFTVVKVGLIVSSVMTVASLFFDFTPSFTKCMVATMILGLVKNSAQQMHENK